VWNEAATVEEGVRTLGAFLDKHLPDHEVLLIESGSDDGTAAMCDALAVEMPRLRVFHEAARNGFGAALRLGIRHARGDLLWIVPVDLPFPLEALLRALPLMEGHHAVLRYRSDDRRPLMRRAQSIGYQALGRALLGIRTRSINSAFKLYRRDAIVDLPLRSRGWTIDAEIIHWLQRRRMSIAEITVPVLERRHGASTVRGTDWIRVAAELLGLRWALRK